MTMHQKTVLITGGTSGIGHEIARRFASLGARLVINGLESDGPEQAASLSREFDVPVLFSPANLLVETEIHQMFDHAEKQLGKVDILINNAGIQHVAPIDQFPSDKWNQIIGVNLSAAFYTSKRAWTKMKEHRWGRIIQIASVHGCVASEYKAAYVAAKHGLIGLTKVLALEGAPHGITCNAICPGYVKTPLVDHQIDDQAKAHQIPCSEVIQKVILAKHAIKDFISPAAIAELCVFLASDHGACITGSSYVLDGGWTAQ